ncbi:hypothetical protein OESDEN_22895 [Oesophagostomum dentatum]|uniref:Peptidase M14 domain-containing protein n=1 Tax=Oesophagostomum dentatum TaxID=61180 RepID=A0A0B1S2L6_OESDE|nr:hypothetical protein OESDEN_22895 [Oesophagostomum dentatum]
MLSPELRGKVDAFLTLHTYSQMWIHPFSHQRKTVPEDINDIVSKFVYYNAILDPKLCTKIEDFILAGNIL